jgi:uncharacterized protein
MKLDRDNSGVNLIRGFSGGEILIGADVIRQPVIVTVDTIIRDWSPPAVEQLTIADLRPVLEFEPDVILLGTGERQCFPSISLIATVLRMGVGLEIMDTAAACRTYNVLVSEYRRVAAALFIR